MGERERKWNVWEYIYKCMKSSSSSFKWLVWSSCVEFCSLGLPLSFLPRGQYHIKAYRTIRSCPSSSSSSSSELGNVSSWIDVLRSGLLPCCAVLCFDLRPRLASSAQCFLSSSSSSSSSSIPHFLDVGTNPSFQKEEEARLSFVCK